MVMEEAYLKASANGTLPAHARQIMYAARPHIQELADRDARRQASTSISPRRFCPTTSRRTGVDWNVVFDARGHFAEPHTPASVPLGTLQVRELSVRRRKAHESIDLDFDIAEDALPDGRPEEPLTARSCSSRRKASCRSSRRCSSPSATTSPSCPPRA